MKWIILEEDPKPDNYIAVVITETIRKMKIEAQAHSVYRDGDEALARGMPGPGCLRQAARHFLLTYFIDNSARLLQADR
jgi:hypothetical protein